MKTPSLHVAYLLLPAPFGGLESVVHLLSGELIGLGQRVTVGVLHLPGGTAEEYARLLHEDGIPTEKLAVSKRGYLSERRMVGGWLRRARPDVLHTHGYRPQVVDAHAARSLGIANVTTFHGFLGHSVRERAYEWLQIWSARKADRVVAVSRAIGMRLERSGVDPERVAILPNGYRARRPTLEREDAREALGIPPDRLALGWVGRISHEKGLDVALRAHASLPVPRPLLVVIGDGRDTATLRSLSRHVGTESDVLWLGSLPSADRLFRGFDAIVVSSRSEGTPMVVFEAAHSGVPIVASRVGEVADMTGEEGALLVEPDQPADLAAALKSIVREPGDARARADRAKARVGERFSAVSWARRHVGLYEETIRLGRATARRASAKRSTR
jgi:glycosyltransferase involved in cell wall biosynthesis